MSETEKELYREILEAMEKKDPHIREELAAYALSFWLPHDWFRRFLMALTFGVGFLKVWDNPWYFLLILFSLMFSPRIVGEVARFLGRIHRLFGG